MDWTRTRSEFSKMRHKLVALFQAKDETIATPETEKCDPNYKIFRE